MAHAFWSVAAYPQRIHRIPFSVEFDWRCLEPTVWNPSIVAASQSSMNTVEALQSMIFLFNGTNRAHSVGMFSFGVERDA